MKRGVYITVFVAVIISLGAMGFSLYEKNFLSQPLDSSDAPLYYGQAFHYSPSKGPYFGQKRGDDDRRTVGLEYIIPNADDTTNSDDEDAFSINYSILKNDSIAGVFLPDIDAHEKTYVVNITVNGAKKGDPVRGWIDFDGNKNFDEYEKAAAAYEGKETVTLKWVLPLHLHTSLTYARFRTCTTVYEDEIEYPSGKTITGEVEDYVVRIMQPIEPFTEERNLLDFGAATNGDNMPFIEMALTNIFLGQAKVTFKISGTIPTVTGINNLHETTVTGLRLGHNEENNITAKPIVTTLYFSKPVENLAFQLLDVDGGDRIKIEAFRNGVIKKFTINNISDNFYTLFNSTTGELHSLGNTDSGTDTLTPSSLDMAAEITYSGFTDSLRLSYFDDAKGTSGTYTLGNISCRKWSFEPPSAKHITAKNSQNTVMLNWNVDTALVANVRKFIVERSNNTISYEAVADVGYTFTDSTGNNFKYIDENISPVQQVCFYRIKTIAVDNSVNYSNVVRIRRNLITDADGFNIYAENKKSIISTPIETATLSLLKDMPGNYEVSLINYAGTKIKTWSFINGHAGDSITLDQFKTLSTDINFIYITNGTQQYMREWLVN
jgi:hypothetical protein